MSEKATHRGCAAGGENSGQPMQLYSPAHPGCSSQEPYRDRGEDHGRDGAFRPAADEDALGMDLQAGVFARDGRGAAVLQVEHLIREVQNVLLLAGSVAAVELGVEPEACGLVLQGVDLELVLVVLEELL